MKIKTYLFSMMLAAALSISAQTPSQFNYQAVLRNAQGTPIANQDVNVTVDIIMGSTSGTVVFSETHSISTSSLGLINLQIGSIENGLGEIEWGADIYFVRITIDGIEYGTSQLLSVPYSMHSRTAETVIGEIDETDPVFGAWDKSTGISITEEQIVDLGDYIEEEIDPVFEAWDKSTGISITESQIIDFGNYIENETQTLADVAAIDNSVNTQIKNLTNPTDMQDAATKSYIDNQVLTLLRILMPQTEGSLNITEGTVNINEYKTNPEQVGADAEAYRVEAIAENTIILEGIGTSGLPAAEALNIFNVGDKMLIINLQGTTDMVNNVGNFEILEVQSVADNTIEFTTSITKTFGDTDNSSLEGQAVIAQRISNYPYLIIENGATLTASPWNGELGGVIAIEADHLILHGAIDASALGYRGGDLFNTVGNRRYGGKGEGIGGYSGFGIDPAYNGGGGGDGFTGLNSSGNSTIAGGGGGSNATAGSVGGTVHEAYVTPGNPGLPHLNNDPIERLYFGGGGGCGINGYYPRLARGGKGGGIVLLMVNDGIFAGQINANGGNHEPYSYNGHVNGTWGGGGAGGSVVIQINNPDTIAPNIHVLGGQSHLNNPDSLSLGGEGFIYIDSALP